MRDEGGGRRGEGVGRCGEKMSIRSTACESVARNISLERIKKRKVDKDQEGNKSGTYFKIMITKKKCYYGYPKRYY